jgi:hypothetical protein
VPTIIAPVVDVSTDERIGSVVALMVYGVRLVVYPIAAFEAVIVNPTPENTVPAASVSVPVVEFILTPGVAGVNPHTTGAARASEFVNVKFTAADVVLTDCGEADPATITGGAGALTEKLRVFVTLIAAFDAVTTKFDARKY